MVTATEPALFVPGSLALLAVQRDAQTARTVLEQFMTLLGQTAAPMTDVEFTGMLRVCQIALIQGDATADTKAKLGDQLAGRFPARNHAVNRELVRILVHVQNGAALQRYFQYLSSAAPEAEKLHLSLQLRCLNEGWKPGQRLRLIDFYEQARRKQGGGSYAGYITNVSRDFAKSLTTAEANEVLTRGAEWPAAALGLLYRLPAELNDETIQVLRELDERVAGSNDETADQLRVGIIAVLARTRLELAMAYLRQTWEREPERRPFIAMGLAQDPSGDNFAYLLRSLPILEGAAAQEVLPRLVTADQRPAAEDSEVFRQVILLGLKLGDDGASDALAV